MNDMKRLVPDLRFPAFLQDGEWKELVFGSLFTFLPNNTLSRADMKEGKGDVYNVHYGDVLIKLNAYTDIQQENLPAIKDVNNIDKYLNARLQNGDIIIADTAEDEVVGKCTEIVNVNNTIVVSGLHTIPCRPQFKFAQAYLGYYLNSNAFHNKLLPIMQGLKVTSISKSSLQNIGLTFPESLEEQQKIADCLSSIDSYITSCNKKVEQLKIHKKSLIQKLFPQIGQIVPEFRFPEYIHTKKWEEKKLGDCFTERVERNFINLPLLSLTESEGVILQEESNRKNNSNVDKSKYLHVCVGDIVYNTMRMWQGRCAFVTFEGIVSPAYTICRPNENMCSLFFNYYFKTSQAIELFHRNSQGLVNDTLNLKYEYFSKIKVPVPLPAEQQRIAKCLKSIDELIKQYINKIVLLEQQKKGLMQQLFPQS